MKKVSLSLVALAVSSILVGCGGSDGDSSSNNNKPGYSIPAEGQFVDAKVQGLHYESGSKSGVTDGDAKYNVDTSNPTVTFSIGGKHGLEIGTISAREVSTPFEAAGTYERSINLARLLLTIDNSSDKSTIVIPAALQNVASSDAVSSALQQISLDSDYFESSLAALLSELGLTTSDIVSAEDAISHMGGSLSDLERGSEAVVSKWARGSNTVLVHRSASQRIRSSESGADKIVVHIDKTLGEAVYNATKTAGFSTYVLEQDKFITASGSNDSAISDGYAEQYLTCVQSSGVSAFSWGSDETPQCNNSDIVATIDLPDAYTYSFVDPTGRQSEETNWEDVASMGGAYECMAESTCSEKTLTQFEVFTRNDKSDNETTDQWLKETLSSSYDPITGVYTQVRSKLNLDDNPNPGREEKSINFLYQVDAVGEDKYVDFIGTWKAIATMPGGCDKVAESTYVFTSTGATVSGKELGGSGSSCTLDDISESQTYEELATKDYWWFTTNSAGDSKATLDQLNTTIRWNDRDDSDTSDYFKINRFSYIPAGSDWDQGTLVRDTLDNSGNKEATVIMRKISQ